MNILPVIQAILHPRDSTRAFQLALVFRQVATLIIAVILAKSGLALDQIGIYEQLFFLGYLVTFFWMEGLLRGMMACYPGWPAETRHKFLSKVGGNLLVLAGLIGVLSVVTGQLLINHLAGGAIPLPLWMGFIVFMLAYQVSFMLEHVYLLESRNAEQVWWMRASFVGLILAVGGSLWVWGTLEAVVLGLVVFGAWRLVGMWRVVRPSWPGRLAGMQTWWKWSVPLIGYALLGGGLPLIDGWVINTHFKDPSVFAVFRYGARELPFSVILAGATGTAFISRLAASWEGELAELKRTTVRLMHGFFPITLVLMVLAPWLYTQVFNEALSEGAAVFRIYLFILISRFVLSPSLLTARGQTKIMLYVGIIELLVNTGLSLWLVQSYGIAGVAWATVAAFTLEKLAHMAVIYHRWGLHPGSYVPLRTLFIYSVLMALAYYLT